VIDVADPDLREHGLTLDLVLSVRGMHEAPRGPTLTGRIALGGPIAVPVTPDYVAGDPGLRAFRLVMVVRAAKDQPASISVTVAATARGNLLRRYQRDFPDLLSLAAVL
jgi:hypothetical protein